LSFDFVLQELGVTVRANRYRCCVGEEVNAVVQLALRGETRRFSEVIAEFLE